MTKTMIIKANTQVHMNEQINRIKAEYKKDGFKVTEVNNMAYGYNKYGAIRLILQKENQTEELLITVDKLWKKSMYDLFYAENPHEVRNIHKHGGSDDF